MGRALRWWLLLNRAENQSTHFALSYKQGQKPNLALAVGAKCVSEKDRDADAHQERNRAGHSEHS